MDPALIAAIIGSATAIGTTAGSFGATASMGRKTRKWNEKMYGIQREDTLEDWNRTMDYNSPANQRRLYEEAGYNPNMITPSGSTTDQPSLPSGPNSGYEAEAQGYRDAFSGFQQGINSTARNSIDLYYKQNQVSGLEAKAALDKAKTELTNTQNAIGLLNLAFNKDSYDDRLGLIKNRSKHSEYQLSMDVHKLVNMGIQNQLAEKKLFAFDSEMELKQRQMLLREQIAQKNYEIAQKRLQLQNRSLSLQEKKAIADDMYKTQSLIDTMERFEKAYQQKENQFNKNFDLKKDFYTLKRQESEFNRKFRTGMLTIAGVKAASDAAYKWTQAGTNALDALIPF